MDKINTKLELLPLMIKEKNNIFNNNKNISKEDFIKSLIKYGKNLIDTGVLDKNMYRQIITISIDLYDRELLKNNKKVKKVLAIYYNYHN